jgi:DNA polymerase III subunit epsilon
MKKDHRLLMAVLAVALGLAAWLAVLVALVGVALTETERQTLAEWLGSRLALVLVLAVSGWVLAIAAAAAVLRHLFKLYVRAPAQLAEQARVLAHVEGSPPLVVQGNTEWQSITDLCNTLAGQRDRMRRDVAAQIAEASRSLQLEKNRLGALMSELSQAVVVCNLEGRVLLYNHQARQQFLALSSAPALAAGAELLGIGRSIYAVFDPQLVAHALETIDRRRACGQGRLTAQFVTSTATGQLLRVQVAPVFGDGAGSASEASEGRHKGVNGFVLMLDNITQTYEADTLRDQLLHGLTEGSRASVANMQAALDMLGYDDTAPVMRDRFMGVLQDELATMSRRLADVTQQSARGLSTRWPLQEMLGADLASAAKAQIERVCGRPLAVDDVAPALWLKVDSFALLQALGYLACRVVDEFGVRFLQLRLEARDGRAQLDLVWGGAAISTETIMQWETDTMRVGGRSTPLSVRDVVARHQGDMWFERDRIRQQAFFRFLLPLTSEQAHDAAAVALLPGDARPEYYDFDLFRQTEQASTLNDRLLTELTYTVFDTETTGLDPSGGDEIIQIGATRIVNGKLLRHECFDQLVDPRRTIAAASVAIHGITPERLKGQPAFAEVMPAFHAFAHDTVLVAHNAAFDMKFLQMKERQTGIVFDQPVLDTLLLSAVVHPNHDAHRIEAIAERLNIAVEGRHTALGDALVTAEVWLRLVPLLNAMGIHTLRQAREAAQGSYYARLTY